MCLEQVIRLSKAASCVILPPVLIATRPVDFRDGNDKDDRAAYAGAL